MLKIIKKHNTKKTFGKVAISEKEYADWCKKTVTITLATFLSYSKKKRNTTF